MLHNFRGLKKISIIILKRFASISCQCIQESELQPNFSVMCVLQHCTRLEEAFVTNLAHSPVKYFQVPVIPVSPVKWGLRVMLTFFWGKNPNFWDLLKNARGVLFWFLCINVTVCILLLHRGMFQLIHLEELFWGQHVNFALNKWANGRPD